LNLQDCAGAAAGSSTATIDTSHAHSGTKSLKFSVAQGDTCIAMAVLGGAPVFPALQNGFWGRMWVWITTVQPGPGGGYIHINNIDAHGYLDAGVQADMHYGASAWSDSGGAHQFLLSNYTTLINWNPGMDSPGGGSDPAIYATPLGQWACYEWSFTSGTTTPQFFLNGTSLPDMNVPSNAGDVWLLPQWDTVSLGWTNWQSSSTPSTMWIDDVALGTQRIGCQ
jgi:hypothetical protein